MNRVQHEVMIEATTMLLAKLKARVPKCSTCNFMWVDGKCDKWKTKPPPDVLRVGCEEWIDDATPF